MINIIVYTSILCLIIYIYFKILYKKDTYKNKNITTGAVGLIIKLISLLVKTNITNIKKDYYKENFDRIIKRLYDFNLDKKTYTKMENFEKDFWISLTKGNNFEDYKIIVEFLVYIENKEYKRIPYFIYKNNFKLLPRLLRIYKDTSFRDVFINKLFLSDTLTKAYQVSSIMNVNLDITIKKMRLVRNIPIIDKDTGSNMITRQAKFPMVGSEVCPFINYINKCNIFNIKLNYSILIIEKEIILEFIQYECNIHESCIIYKDNYDTIKHLEEFEFWNDNKYWENKYPKEKEII